MVTVTHGFSESWAPSSSKAFSIRGLVVYVIYLNLKGQTENIVAVICWNNMNMTAYTPNPSFSFHQMFQVGAVFHASLWSSFLISMCSVDHGNDGTFLTSGLSPSRGCHNSIRYLPHRKRGSLCRRRSRRHHRTYLRRDTRREGSPDRMERDRKQELPSQLQQR